VTSVCHIDMQLDEMGRRLVGLLDGKRTHREIAAAWKVERAREVLGPCLEWMASHGLLDG
jgi:hypothetical protein